MSERQKVNHFVPGGSFLAVMQFGEKHELVARTCFVGSRPSSAGLGAELHVAPRAPVTVGMLGTSRGNDPTKPQTGMMAEWHRTETRFSGGGHFVARALYRLTRVSKCGNKQICISLDCRAPWRLARSRPCDPKGCHNAWVQPQRTWGQTASRRQVRWTFSACPTDLMSRGKGYVGTPKPSTDSKQIT